MRAPQQEDSVDLGAVTSVRVYLFPLFVVGSNIWISYLLMGVQIRIIGKFADLLRVYEILFCLVSVVYFS